MNFAYDTFLKKIDILSKALEKATERTRSMLYIVTFFSLIVLLSAFTANFSWDRKLNNDERLLLNKELNFVPSSSIKPFQINLVKRLRQVSSQKSRKIANDIEDNLPVGINNLQKYCSNDTSLTNALDAFVDSLRKNNLLVSPNDFFKVFIDRQKFTIPILGLSCYADDLYIVGGLGLVILLTYAFFSVRRENKIVERIEVTIQFIYNNDPQTYLDDTTLDNDKIKIIKHNLLEFVFYGCVEFFTFNTGLSKDDYVRNDKNTNENRASTLADINSNKAVERKQNMKAENQLGRITLSLIYLLPLISMGFAFCCEIYTFYSRQAHLRESDKWEIIARYFITAILFAVIIRQTVVINKLNRANSTLIDRMYKIILGSRNDLGLH